MPVTKRVARGIQDIKTISGRSEKGMTYKAYMRLSVLEMEKFRRGKEKSSALARVANIDSRFGDIEKERAEIIQALGVQSLPKACGKGSTAPRSSTGAFNIRY